jgi:hypothetical protein
MEEMSVANNKTSSKCKEHTYAQRKETRERYGHFGECFLQGYMCQVTKEKIARLATERMHKQEDK